MRCIFCKLDSSLSRSVEHIIPESLGNKSHTLRPGIVCDRCNNYFSREVERPFLESLGMKTLRFHQMLESKKGRVPPVMGLIWPDVPAEVTQHTNPEFTSVSVPEEAIKKILEAGSGKLILPVETPLPSGPIISRFLAKVALEFMAARLAAYSEGLEYLCNETQLDLLRNHARRGTTPIWPIHARRIYSPNAKTVSPDGRLEQLVHESDFLVTTKSEWFFVLAIFGDEISINLGGPHINGYLEWLRENNNQSPLYAGKNSVGYAMPTY